MAEQDYSRKGCITSTPRLLSDLLKSVEISFIKVFINIIDLVIEILAKGSLMTK